MIRAEGGLVNPYRSSLLEGHLTALSGDPEPRRAPTPPLPHIRQANVDVTQTAYGIGQPTVKFAIEIARIRP